MKVAVGTDGSDCSRYALERLAALLPLEGAEVFLVAVAPRPVASDVTGALGPPYVDYTMLADEIRKETEATLSSGSDTLRAHGIQPQQVYLEGDAADKLIEWARVQRPDILVVGSHGRTGFQRLLLGSVSAKVVNDAPCPVLVVKKAHDGR